MSTPSAEKMSAALRLILDGNSMLVDLDARRDDVIVPDYLKEMYHVALLIGTALSNPIPDLDITAEGIRGTLSFNRTPFWCEIPWSAVFSMRSKQDAIRFTWYNDAPAEVFTLAPTFPGTPVPAALPPPIDLMARRSVADRVACRRRLAKLTAPRAPRGGGTAA